MSTRLPCLPVGAVHIDGVSGGQCLDTKAAGIDAKVDGFHGYLPTERNTQTLSVFVLQHPKISDKYFSVAFFLSLWRKLVKGGVYV